MDSFFGGAISIQLIRSARKQERLLAIYFNPLNAKLRRSSSHNNQTKSESNFAIRHGLETFRCDGLLRNIFAAYAAADEALYIYMTIDSIIIYIKATIMNYFNELQLLTAEKIYQMDFGLVRLYLAGLTGLSH